MAIRLRALHRQDRRRFRRPLPRLARSVAAGATSNYAALAPARQSVTDLSILRAATLARSLNCSKVATTSPP